MCTMVTGPGYENVVGCLSKRKESCSGEGVICDVRLGFVLGLCVGIKGSLTECERVFVSDSGSLGCVGLTRWRTTLPVRAVTESFIVVPQNGQISRRRINIEQVFRGKVSVANKGELQIGALGCAYGKGDFKMEKDSLAADGRVIR